MSKISIPDYAYDLLSENGWDRDTVENIQVEYNPEDDYVLIAVTWQALYLYNRDTSEWVTVDNNYKQKIGVWKYWTNASSWIRIDTEW